MKKKSLFFLYLIRNKNDNEKFNKDKSKSI